MFPAAVRLRLLERHVALGIHYQLAVHSAVRIRHVHSLVRDQGHARRKFRHRHGNCRIGKHVGIVTNHVTLHAGQVGAFHLDIHSFRRTHHVAVRVRHRELEAVFGIGTGSRQVIVELTRFRIQRHRLALHSERPGLAAVSADACNLFTAVHGKLDLRTFAVVRAEVEVHRTVNAFTVRAGELTHRQGRHVVHNIKPNFAAGTVAVRVRYCDSKVV